MANPIPCALCEGAAQSDILLTSTSENTWPPGPWTQALCYQCFLGYAYASIQHEQDSEQEVTPVPPESQERPEPTVGIVAPETTGGPPDEPAPKKRQAKTEPNGAAATEVAAEAAHD